jgi:hypothetical protein
MQAPATPADLRAKAEHYREMVTMVSDQRIIDALISLAEEYEATALSLESRGSPGHPAV